MYSVKNPITNPAHNPVAVQINACHGFLSSLENTLTPKVNVSGRVIAADK